MRGTMMTTVTIRTGRMAQKKSPNMTHKDLHLRSEAGKKKDAERRTMKRKAKRRNIKNAQDAVDDDDVIIEET